MVKHKRKKNKYKKLSSRKRRLSSRGSRYKRTINSRPIIRHLDYRPFVVLIGLIIIGISLYKVALRVTKTNDISSSLVKNVIHKIKEEYPDGFWNKYSRGYKIVIIDHKNIIPTNIDTLPEGLNIDWKEVSTLRVRPEEKKENPALAKIQIPAVSYPDCGVNSLVITNTFTRVKGVRVRLADFCGRQFVMEVLEAYEDYTVCLFGIE